MRLGKQKQSLVIGDDGRRERNSIDCFLVSVHYSEMYTLSVGGKELNCPCYYLLNSLVVQSFIMRRLGLNIRNTRESGESIRSLNDSGLLSAQCGMTIFAVRWERSLASCKEALVWFRTGPKQG